MKMNEDTSKRSVDLFGSLDALARDLHAQGLTLEMDKAIDARNSICSLIQISSWSRARDLRRSHFRPSTTIPA